MRFSRHAVAPLAAFLFICAAGRPAALRAQQGTPPVTPPPVTPPVARDSAPGTSAAARSPILVPPRPFGALGPHLLRWHDSLPTLVASPALLPFGRLAEARTSSEVVAAAGRAALEANFQARFSSLWGQIVAAGPPVVLPTGGGGPTVSPAGTPPPLSTGAVGAIPVVRDTASNFASGMFSQYADLGLELNARLETKAESNKNDRCSAVELFSVASNCNGRFQPQFDFQFNLRSGGVIADRVHLNVDYDSQREFDASNNISVYYEGKTDELLQRLEVGNVSFQPPPSRFITGGIPSGNYGLQAVGQLGPMRFRTIVAQQKGNVVKDRIFTVGERSERTVDNAVEDYQFQQRQFFFTVDPRRLPGYPNLDILNRQQMEAAAASLPDSLRPTGVNLYRWRRGAPPVNPNGPKFSVRGSHSTVRNVNPYEYLRAGVDYYVDPSNLWVALVHPVDEQEQLVVAYRVRRGAADTVNVNTGGTPDIEYRPESQVANLLWENEVSPADTGYFEREIRSVYRVGGEDIQRSTVAVKLATGASGDQERPAAGGADSYLQLFRLSQSTNSSTFDVDNRLWPRVGDANTSLAGVSGGRLIRDYFLVFPSLRPFSSLAAAGGTGNPTNDSLYTALSSDFRSQRRPATVYHLRMRFSASGGAETGKLALGSVQLRRNSERLVIGGLALKRDVDYTVEYETGEVTFLHPDTLFRTPQQVQAQFEENPLFAGNAPTNLFGFASTFPMTNGQVSFTAISQSQRTAFNRPPLGSEPASSLVAGVSGEFQFDADQLSLALKRMPFGNRVGPSQIGVSGEFATSRPQPNSAGQAYVESFEGEGGVDVALNSASWYFASQPSAGTRALFGGADNAGVFDTSRAATLAWQGVGRLSLNGTVYTPVFGPREIDPAVVTSGGTFTANEPVLWMTLQPLTVGGLFAGDISKPVARWVNPRTAQTPVGRRWRSIRTVLNPSGADLSRVENFEFWALINVDSVGGGSRHNPTLVFDFGDVSENSVALSPTTACLSCTLPGTSTVVDTLFTGRQLAGLGRLDSERDSLTRGFDQARNDVGLAGDRAPTLRIVTNGGASGTALDVPLCTGGDLAVRRLGDPAADCTIRNNRLDEEDVDQDGSLNINTVPTTGENVLRYAVDLANLGLVDRLGGCFDTTRVTQADSVGCVAGRGARWAHYRVSFRAPTDSIGAPNARLIRALRMTMVSSASAGEDEVQQIAVARFHLQGAPWVKRADRPLLGIAGAASSPTGTVIASVIGTLDRNGIDRYQSPPGVTDEANSKQTNLSGGSSIAINERSMRVQAVGLKPFERAEAYFRFDGTRNFMGYKEMRVWARGVGNGWNDDGALQFFVKAGRDESNFYLYRRPVRSGQTQAAWTDAAVDLERFYDLRARIQNAFLRNTARQTSCTDPSDLALIRNSATGLRTAGSSETSVYAECYAAPDGGHYMALTVNPNVSPPNLAAVQDLSVGIVRVDSAGAGQPLPGDTLELWVDDIRLTSVVNTPGYAGQVGLTVNAGDIANVRMNVSRRDPNFRQLGEQSTFVTDNAFDVSTTIALERILPQSLGISLPLTVAHSRSSSNPFFLAQSDVRGAGIVGLRTPQASSTNYQLALQRTSPMANRFLGPVVNNLVLNGSYTVGDARSEFSEGHSNAYAVNAAYALTAQARSARLPATLDRAIMHLPSWFAESSPMRALRGSEVRLNPTAIRFTSALARAEDRHAAFTKPAEGATDTTRYVRSLQNVWRNNGSIELRPVPSLAARWDVSSTRDLRRYDDSASVRPNGSGGLSNFAPVLTAERSRLLGLDVGLETARNMNGSVSWAPAFSAWFRPRLDVGSNFNMIRDPNSPSLVYEGANRVTFTGGDTLADTLPSFVNGRARLPRQLQNSQVFTAGSSFDLGRALLGGTTRPGLVRRQLGGFLQPLDVTYSRTLSSVFSDAASTPGLGYQFAIGGLDRFLAFGGRPATSAVLANQLSANQSFNLPLGMVVVSRFQRNASRTYTNRVVAQTNEVSQVAWPNANLRWSFTPPALIRSFVSSVGANLGVEGTRTHTQSTGATAGAPNETSDDSQRSYPLTGSVTWARGGLATSASYALTDRTYSRPGARGSTRSTDVGFDIGKAFSLPASFKTRDKLNTHVAYQSKVHETIDFSAAASASAADAALVRRVTGAGSTRAFNLNADTRLSPSVLGTLTFSRTVTSDAYRGTRYTQSLVSAVLQLQFFAGELH